MFATIDDMKNRWGEAKVIEWGSLAQENPLGDGVPVVDSNSYEQVINLYLEDACDIMVQELRCCYDFNAIKKLVDSGETFKALKLRQMRLAIQLLESRGDCKECSCPDKEGICDMDCLCTVEGNCVHAEINIAVSDRPNCMPNFCPEHDDPCGCN